MPQPLDIGRALVRRRRALGLSQRELGERVGVKQPQIARWEASGYRTASLERVHALAEALGYESEPVPTAAEEKAAYGTATAVRPVRDLGEVIQRVRDNADSLRALGMRRLRVFGSFVRGEQSDTSDVDFLVDYDRRPDGFAYFGAGTRLEELLGRDVDLCEEALLKERLRPRATREAVEVWSAG